MAAEFICDGCGRRGKGQQVGSSEYGAIFVKPAGWKTAILQGDELQVCSVACAVSAEMKRGLKPAPILIGAR